VFTEERDKDEMIFNYFDAILGIAPTCSNTINMQALGLSTLNLQELGERFTEEEILKVIRSIAPDKAPGPNGFTVCFMQAIWEIIHLDVMHTFDALWHLDMRDMHYVNDALLVLLPKTVEPSTVKDYRPILLRPFTVEVL
jgi:hypothetical protein